MKKSEEIFYFTLIDFLIQIFFFGLVLYAASNYLNGKKNAEREANEKQIAQMLKATGVSNLTELSDDLSKLGPLKELKGTADFISRNGGPTKVEETVKVINSAGGIEEVKKAVKTYEEAYGKKPCHYLTVAGKQVPKTLARFRVNDDYIEMLSSSEEMDLLLAKLGKNSEQVKNLGLEEFKSTFGPIKTIYPNCAHFVEVKVNTKFILPMRSIWAGFKVK
jgi:hypothetical protein